MKANSLRTLVRRIGSALVTLGVLAMLTWLIGRVLSDRFLWSQYISWIPEAPLLLSALAALALGRAANWCAREPDTSDPSRRVRAVTAQRVVWVAWACCMAWVVLVRWHGVRYIAPIKPDEAGVRVVVWNPAELTMRGFEDRLIPLEADILVVANPSAFADWAKLRVQMAADSSSIRFRALAMASRFRIVAWGWRELDITPAGSSLVRVPGEPLVSGEGGIAFWARLDAREALGREVVVWAFDMPSDPNLPRWRVMEEAHRAVSGVGGASFARDEHGMDSPLPGGAFPEADLIVGDFNTPAASASLGVLVGDAEHAFDQAGRGWARSFPASRPLVHIDHIFVGGGLRATEYRLMDLGAGRHLAQYAVISGAK